MDWLGIALSSGAAVALITAAKELILWRLNRGDKAYSKRLEAVDAKLVTITASLDAQAVGVRESLRDRIEYLAGVYIERGSITMHERGGLARMHAAYHNLGGNGHLDSLMTQVEDLPVKEH